MNQQLRRLLSRFPSSSLEFIFRLGIPPSGFLIPRSALLFADITRFYRLYIPFYSSLASIREVETFSDNFYSRHNRRSLMYRTNIVVIYIYIPTYRARCSIGCYEPRVTKPIDCTDQ